jgi:hypothetical protein
VEADSLDQKQILDCLEETIRELDEPHRHLVELRLNRIRTAFAGGDVHGRQPSGSEWVDVDPVQRFRAARREAVLQAHISTLAADLSLLLNEPGAGAQARRFRDLLRNLDASTQAPVPSAHPTVPPPTADAAEESSSTLDPAVIANPVIDDAWFEKEIAALRVKLGAEFPQLTPRTIAAALELATTRVAAGARIPNFLPVLVARDAREWLTSQLVRSGD